MPESNTRGSFYKEMAGWLTLKKRVAVLAVLLIIPVLLSLRTTVVPKIEMEPMSVSFLMQPQGVSMSYQGVAMPYQGAPVADQGVPVADQGVRMSNQGDLEYDFYRTTCPQAESIVRSVMSQTYSRRKEVPPQLLRLFFHDCFIKGCDASVFLDNKNGNQSHPIEKQAIPNKTLKGFEVIDDIKEKLEAVCPGMVSCADTLALATREGVVLAGGPFFPVITGRKDSTQSYYQEALADIPKPSGNITETLNLFSERGFSTRETVSLLGAHNVGIISCEFFLQNRVNDFDGTGRPDPSIPSDFVRELRQKCQESNGSIQDSGAPTPVMFQQRSPASIPSGQNFDGHYYQNLLKGRGVLFSDQQLMADPDTASIVRIYASDDGTTFRRDFSRAMMKMSKLGVLTRTDGEVRTKCSLPARRY